MPRLRSLCVDLPTTIASGLMRSGRPTIPSTAPTVMAVCNAMGVCRRPANLRRTARIAFTVGCVLTAINQADVLIEGRATAITAVKIVLNFVVPFIVSNLGVLAGTRAAAVP